ncbi:MAG: hypothetical protein EBV25_04305, partial [Methylophilaceae bacterium]|nr:hypothetical protein [Methylophilaceae bacterium]
MNKIGTTLSPYTLWNNTTGIELQSDGAAASTTIAGTTIYVGYTNRCPINDGGIMTVNIDGVNVDRIDVDACQANVVYPAVRRYSGLSDGVHTVTLTATISGPQYVDIDYVASNKSLTGTKNAYVYSGGSIYATSSYAYSNVGTDNDVKTYNERNQQVSNELAADGLPVMYVDVNRYFNPWNGDMSSDSIHPNDNGNTQIAYAFLDAMNSAINPSEKNGARYSIELAKTLAILDNGNIGIGTTSPEAKLYISATSSKIFILDNTAPASSTLMQFRNSGTSKGYIGYSTLGTGGLAFMNAAGTTANMLVTDGGLVGIGSTTPTALLSIATPAGATGSQMQLFNIASSTASATTTLFTVFNSGMVGIGSTTPSANLSILGNTNSLNVLGVYGGNGVTAVQGQNITMVTGAGLGSGSQGALGGDFSITTGAGGAGGGGTTGMRGGNLNVVLGNGAATPSSGNGGSFSLIAGNGGGGTAVQPGTGGAISLTAGNGGAQAAGVALNANGGSITFTSGNAGSVATGGANGGNIIFALGTGTGTGVSGNVGIGTTTPNYALTSYSATAPQLSLSAGAGLAQWTMRNAGSNLYFATTTVA